MKEREGGEEERDKEPVWQKLWAPGRGGAELVRDTTDIHSSHGTNFFTWGEEGSEAS